MDKCHQDKCWLVQIETVTAEIFLIWTNVARTNVVGKIVAVTVEFCSTCSQDPMVVGGGGV